MIVLQNLLLEGVNQSALLPLGIPVPLKEAVQAIECLYFHLSRGFSQAASPYFRMGKSKRLPKKALVTLRPLFGHPQSWDQLPHDLFKSICEYLPPKEISACMQVCKRWRYLLHEQAHVGLAYRLYTKRANVPTGNQFRLRLIRTSGLTFPLLLTVTTIVLTLFYFYHLTALVNTNLRPQEQLRLMQLYNNARVPCGPVRISRPQSERYTNVHQFMADGKHYEFLVPKWHEHLGSLLIGLYIVTLLLLSRFAYFYFSSVGTNTMKVQITRNVQLPSELSYDPAMKNYLHPKTKKILVLPIENCQTHALEDFSSFVTDPITMNIKWPPGTHPHHYIFRQDIFNAIQKHLRSRPGCLIQ